MWFPNADHRKSALGQVITLHEIAVEQAFDTGFRGSQCLDCESSASTLCLACVIDVEVFGAHVSRSEPMRRRWCAKLEQGQLRKTRVCGARQNQEAYLLRPHHGLARQGMRHSLTNVFPAVEEASAASELDDRCSTIDHRWVGCERMITANL